MLLDGWVAAHRNDRSAAEEAYRRTLDLSRSSGFADHAAFALARLGATALAAGDPHLAEQLFRQALAAAEAARAPWVAAHSAGRARPGTRRRSGTRPRQSGCIGPSSTGPSVPRSHRARETLFFALAGDPATGGAPRPRRPCRRARRRGRGGRPASARRARDHLTILLARQRRGLGWQRRGSRLRDRSSIDESKGGTNEPGIRHSESRSLGDRPQRRAVRGVRGNDSDLARYRPVCVRRSSSAPTRWQAALSAL